MFTACVPAVIAPAIILTVPFCAVAPLFILVVFTPPVPSPIVTVDAPEPEAIFTVDVALELPRVITPVDCDVPPIVIVPVVVEAPIEYVVPAAPSREKLPN